MADQKEIDFKNYGHGAQMASVAIKVGYMAGPPNQIDNDVRESIIACGAVLLGAVVDEGKFSEDEVITKVKNLIAYSRDLAQEARASQQQDAN